MNAESDSEEWRRRRGTMNDYEMRVRKEEVGEKKMEEGRQEKKKRIKR